MDLGPPNLEDRAGLWRIAPAATKLGISPDALEAASLAGTIPIEVLRIGPRSLRYVRFSELQAFLAARPASGARENG
jgi:hypothetical protein